MLTMAESVIKRFSGDGMVGYSDGELGTARFERPRSFAIDRRGNVYVADKINHVIRKISGSGQNPTFISHFQQLLREKESNFVVVVHVQV